MQEIDFGSPWDQPVTPEAPAGPDLEYSAGFAELEAATAETPEQQYGSTVIPAKPPDWERVLELGSRLAQQTIDLRIMLPMTRALTRLHGLPGLLQGLRAINRVLESHWETVHPQLVLDGAPDPHIRFGALAQFGAGDGLVGDLRQAIVLQSPLGVFCVRDLERLAEQGSAEINGIPVDGAQFDAMVQDLRRTQPQALEGPAQVIEEFRRMLAGVEARMGGEFTPDYSMLLRPLERARNILNAAIDENVQSFAQDDDSAAVAESLPAAERGSFPGGIHSRADVLKAMDAICAYLERQEPTNPAPLLVRRARRLMDMNFLDIVRDMSPDGVNQVLAIAGAEPEDVSDA